MENYFEMSVTQITGPERAARVCSQCDVMVASDRKLFKIGMRHGSGTNITILCEYHIRLLSAKIETAQALAGLENGAVESELVEDECKTCELPQGECVCE